MPSSLAFFGKKQWQIKSSKLSVKTDRNIYEHTCRFIVIVWFFPCSLSISTDGKKCYISVDWGQHKMWTPQSGPPIFALKKKQAPDLIINLRTKHV